MRVLTHLDSNLQRLNCVTWTPFSNTTPMCKYVTPKTWNVLALASRSFGHRLPPRCPPQLRRAHCRRPRRHCRGRTTQKGRELGRFGVFRSPNLEETETDENRSFRLKASCAGGYIFYVCPTWKVFLAAIFPHPPYLGAKNGVPRQTRRSAFGCSTPL